MAQIAAIRVVAAVIVRGTDYLVCQRPLNKRHGNLWEFPGGKCEPGESDAAALHRELREELGVNAISIGAELFAAQDPNSPFVIAFIPVAINGEPTCLEHSALIWAPLSTLQNMPLAPSDRRFVEHLQA